MSTRPKMPDLAERAAVHGVSLRTAQIIDAYARRIAAALPAPSKAEREHLGSLFSGLDDDDRDDDRALTA